MKNNKFRYLSNRIDSTMLATIKKALGAFPVQILGLLCSFAISIYVSRNFGANGVGILNLSRRIVEFSVLVALLGAAPTYLVKMVSQQIVLNKSNEINSKLLSLLFYIIPLGAITTIGIGVFSDDIAKFLNNKEFSSYVFLFALNIIPLLLIQFFSVALNGKKQIVENTFFKMLFSPLIILCFIGLFYLFKVKLNLTTFFYIIIGANVIVCGILLAFWFKQNKLKAIQLNLNYKVNTFKMFPFFIVGVSTFLYSKIDVFIIGYYLDTDDVGLYSVAFRLGMLVSLIHLVVGKTLAPVISDMLVLDQKKPLEILLQKYSAILFVVSIFIFIFFLVFGKLILSVWGDEFVSAYYCLLIIIVGQCFNVFMGYTGLVLMMAGYEKNVSNITLFMVPINVVLNILLISCYGIVGGAISFVTCVVLENIIKFILVKKQLQMSCIKYL